MDRIDLIEQEIFDYSNTLLDILLSDKTTGSYIRWGTNDYSAHGEDFGEDKEIRPALVTGSHTMLIQPRTVKSKEEQQRRTKDKAEVFTPLWVCNAQNNLVDEAWFGKASPFNTSSETGWLATESPVSFDKKRTWAQYVRKNVLEMACGEAPYLVSRYDPVTGEKISISQRVGLLDRKLRVVNENTHTEQSWSVWAMRAFQSTYGFDYQGDNVLLARENLLATYLEYFYERFGHAPKLQRTKQFAEVIAWNIWQMDGLKGTVPYVTSPAVTPSYKQEQLFVLEEPCDIPKLAESNPQPVYCKIFDWEVNEAIEYVSLLKG